MHPYIHLHVYNILRCKFANTYIHVQLVNYTHSFAPYTYVHVHPQMCIYYIWFYNSKIVNYCDI